MRKIATIKLANADARRVIMHENKDGVYVFPCASLEDGSATGDSWYSTLEEADEMCLRKYNVGQEDWEPLDDPLPGCQQDWIAPVRVKGRDLGKPQWGVLERFENGEWKECARNPELIARYLEE